MIKKMMLLAVAAAAIVAFAVPAAASATPLVHDEAGNGVESVTATSEDTVWTTAVGTVDCATEELSINLSENTTTTALGSGTGAWFGTKGGAHEAEEHCEGPFGATSIEDVTVSSLHLEDDTTGHAEFAYVRSMLPQCTIDGTAAVKWTHGGTLTIEGSLEGTPREFPCTLLDGTIHGTFHLDGGVTIG